MECKRGYHLASKRSTKSWLEFYGDIRFASPLRIFVAEGQGLSTEWHDYRDSYNEKSAFSQIRLLREIKSGTLTYWLLARGWGRLVPWL